MRKIPSETDQPRPAFFERRRPRVVAGAPGGPGDPPREEHTKNGRPGGSALCSPEPCRTWHVVGAELAPVRRGTTGTARRYKVTLVGLGAMGQRHARILRALETRFELVGAFDPREAARTPEGTERLRCETEALARAEVVIVATPIETHAGIVARGLAAGRHVFVEKPVCATAGEARAASAASAPGRSGNGGARIFVGHSERFNPVVRTLAKLVRDDRVLAIDLRRVGPSKPCGSGVLVNLGVHDFDLAAYLGGGEVTLRGAIGFGTGAAPWEDAAHVLFATAGGAPGHLYVDRGMPMRERAIELTTTRWVYRGDLLAHRLVRTTPLQAGAASAGRPAAARRAARRASRRPRRCARRGDAARDRRGRGRGARPRARRAGARTLRRGRARCDRAPRGSRPHRKLVDRRPPLIRLGSIWPAARSRIDSVRCFARALATRGRPRSGRSWSSRTSTSRSSTARPSSGG